MMTIVLATDDCFAQHCAVAMRSVLDHNEDVEFYILTEGLSEENQKKLRSILPPSNGRDGVGLSFCIVDSEAVKDMPMPDNKQEKISIATYYRLFITKLLPDTVSKVLYLDCDIVVRGSLQELWDTDIHDKALAAVHYPMCPTMQKNCKRLGIPEEQGYFNAGILLINLDYWRTHDLPQRYFDFIREGKYPLLQRDQDVLNAVTGAETVNLPWKFNAMLNELELINEQLGLPKKSSPRGGEEGVVIVHFSFRLKPWEFGCRNPYKKEYREILKRTPWKGAPLHFSWFDFYEFWIKPMIIAPMSKKIKSSRI